MTENARKTRLGHLYKRTKDGQTILADDPRHGTYWLQYAIGGKRFRKSLGTKNRKKAEAERKKIMAPIAVASEKEELERTVARLKATEERFESLQDEQKAPLLIANTWQAYLRSPNRPDPGERTLGDYEGYFRRFRTWLVSRHPDIRALREVTPEVARRYASHLGAESSSPGTFNKHRDFLKRLFEVLEDEAGIVRNPFDKIARKKGKTNSRRELTIDELHRVLDSAKGDMEVLLALGTFTGMRLGDCATLEWSEVDLQRGIIKRVPNKTARSDGKPVVLGIPQYLAELLSQTSPPSRRGYVLSNIAEEYKDKGGSRSELTRRIQRHFDACGIRTTKEGTGFKKVEGKDGKTKSVHTGKRAVLEVGFHSLRHTYVSLHAEGGTPAGIIQANVGHSNPAMTRHYTHVSDTAAVEYAKRLPALGEHPSPDEVRPAKDEVIQLLESATNRNWKSVITKALELLRSSAELTQPPDRIHSRSEEVASAASAPRH